MKYALLFALMIFSTTTFAGKLLCKSPANSDLLITFQENSKILVEMVGDTRPVRGVFYGAQTSLSETAYDKVVEYDLNGPRGGGTMKIKNEFLNFPPSCRNPRNCSGETVKFPVKFSVELNYVGLSYFNCKQL